MKHYNSNAKCGKQIAQLLQKYNNYIMHRDDGNINKHTHRHKKATGRPVRYKNTHSYTNTPQKKVKKST